MKWGKKIANEKRLENRLVLPIGGEFLYQEAFIKERGTLLSMSPLMVLYVGHWKDRLIELRGSDRRSMVSYVGGFGQSTHRLVY